MKLCQINSIRNRQLIDICALRVKMAEFLHDLGPEIVLSVGEGTSWQATWIGFSAESRAFPESIRLVVALDLQARRGSVYERPEIWSNYAIAPLFGDATCLPFVSESFDMVVSPLMIDDCADHFALVTEMHRCTHCGGVLMIAGHGLDSIGELRGVSGLFGSRHQYPCDPNIIDQYAAGLELENLVRWQNEHTWLRVFQKMQSKVNNFEGLEVYPWMGI